MKPPIGWMTSWRCGCTYVGREHKHPTYCPYHAPGLLTEADKPTLQARTERLAFTEPIHTEPIVWGLLVEHLEAVWRERDRTRLPSLHHLPHRPIHRTGPSVRPPALLLRPSRVPRRRVVGAA